MPATDATPETTAAAPARPKKALPKAKPAVAVKPATPAAAPAAKKKAPAKAKPAKPAEAIATKPPKLKQKLVRDSFTMPQADFDLIDPLKQRALAMLRPAKKSELLRAGLQVLAALPDAELKAALDRLATLKPGRPKKAD